MTCDLCSGRLHFRDNDGSYSRCSCFIKHLQLRRQEAFKDVVAVDYSPLAEKLTKSIRVECSPNRFRQHLARIALSKASFNICALDSNVLMDRLMGKKNNNTSFLTVDLLVIDFNSAMRNRHIPSYLAGILRSRRLREKASWLLLHEWDLPSLISRIDPDHSAAAIDDFEKIITSFEEIKL